MGYWQIERSSDGFVVVVEAENREQAETLFDAEYGLGPDDQIVESDADEYAEFQRDAANDTPWYS